jgi:hypothetical protein
VTGKPVLLIILGSNQHDHELPSSFSCLLDGDHWSGHYEDRGVQECIKVMKTDGGNVWF